MLKKTVLKIISGKEFARVIKKDPSQVTRMPNKVPAEYHSKLRTACRNKLAKYQEALNEVMK